MGAGAEGRWKGEYAYRADGFSVTKDGTNAREDDGGDDCPDDADHRRENGSDAKPDQATEEGPEAKEVAAAGSDQICRDLGGCGAVPDLNGTGCRGV